MVKKNCRRSSVFIFICTLAVSFSNIHASDTPLAVQINGEHVDETKILTPDLAIEELKKGHKRFIDDKELNQHYTSQIEATKSGQHPHTVMLSCIDSRIPPEVIFDQGIGDVFVARVAGNIENRDILGSLEFATKVKGSKLILVLGHTSCGAIEGACADVKLGNLTGLLNEIKPAMATVSKKNLSLDKKSKDFSELVSVENVMQTIRDIQKKSPVISELVKSGKLKIVGAMYDVATGKVEFL